MATYKVETGQECGDGPNEGPYMLASYGDCQAPDTCYCAMHHAKWHYRSNGLTLCNPRTHKGANTSRRTDCYYETKSEAKSPIPPERRCVNCDKKDPPW